MRLLQKPALRGAAWTVIGFGASQTLRFIGNLILTRLLVPEYFGMMAVVNSLNIGLNLFSDIGIQQSIVQNKAGAEPEFLNTAWTLQIFRGWFIFALILLCAGPVGHYYNEPVLTPVIIITGFSTVINGFISTKLWRLNRSLKLGWLISLELISSFLGLTAMVIWAWLSPSIWALPIGSVVSATAKASMSHLVLPGPSNRPQWNRKFLDEIVNFGRWVMVASGVMFLANQADRFIMAKLLSFSVLGVYTVAVTLAELPKQIVGELNYRVIFPVVSQNADLPRPTLRAKILTQRRLILLAFAAGIAISAAFGDLLISTLYDERYQEATWMFSMLCLGVWFSVLFYTSVPCLMGVGKPIYSAQGNVLRLLVIVIGIPLGHHWAGAFGAILAIAVSDFPAYVGIQYGLWREQLSFLRQDLLLTTALGLGVTVLLAGRYGLGLGTPFDRLWA
ncbi:MAG: oligosaccharide flippase family protein [Nodosilinea sp.]